MTDYHLYAHKNSYAMTTHLMLEELGLEYDVSWFNVHQPDTFPDEFLDLNPNAKVPVLVTPDGPIYESGATLMYLSEHHGNQFMPEGSSQRARAQQWLIYLMSTLQPEVLIQFNAERYFPEDADLQDTLRAASLRELEFIWKIIEDAFEPGPWFVDDNYSICDILFLMQAVWTENQPADLSQFPNSVRMMKTAFERPAVQRTIEIHGIKHLTKLASGD